ncbi:MAG TPA: ParB N-terminal domain-containing protein [Polyangium sp.]|nr:ParB N-terminal domain-containing protein [Polyangium sp.]
MKRIHSEEHEISPADLGEQLSHLRLRDAAALENMRRSLDRHGQLESVVAFECQDKLEVIDGFKRVIAARALNWSSLRVRLIDADIVEAKCMLIALHDRRGMTELEEGWLIRSLYRDDNLSQPAIAQRLGRDKSWVCRRLMLVESLDQAVQADVRLGLLVPRAAMAIGQLPRGNQAAAAQFAIRRGLTVRQTELFVAEIGDSPDAKSQAQEITHRLESMGPMSEKRTKPKRSIRNETDWISADIHTIRQTAARLEARLLEKPLETLGCQAADLIRGSLIGLAPVLCALLNTIDKVNAEKKEAA